MEQGNEEELVLTIAKWKHLGKEYKVISFPRIDYFENGEKKTGCSQSLLMKRSKFWTLFPNVSTYKKLETDMLNIDNLTYEEIKKLRSPKISSLVKRRFNVEI